MDYQRPSTRQDFEVAIICASPLEFNAISLLFDQFWDEDGDPYGRATGDPNYYTTGRFGKYDVVLALLTRTDRATAASAAASIRTSYSGLRLALFVGICSGVPQIHDGDDEDEIMLGDVVISSTVVQYDFDTQHPKKYIHKNTVENNSAFIEVLKEAFDGLGSKKLDRGDWFLEDVNDGQILDLKREWISLMKPGRTLHMGMIFHRRDTVSTQCPTCHVENLGDPTEQLLRFNVSPYRGDPRDRTLGRRLSTPQATANTATSKRFNSHKIQPTQIPPLARPRPPKSDDEDDDITRYKRIRVVNTNFQLRRIEEGRTTSGHITVTLQNLTDTECLADYLSKTYGVPEVDCLAALEECKPILLAAKSLSSSSLSNTGEVSKIPGVGGPQNQSSPMMPQGPDGNTFNAFDFYNIDMGGPGAMRRGGPAAAVSNHPLHDYHVQLMLLEQQNKKRLMMAREEQSDMDVEKNDYHMQLMLLEQQNKKRLMMACQVQGDMDVEKNNHVLGNANGVETGSSGTGDETEDDRAYMTRRGAITNIERLAVNDDSLAQEYHSQNPQSRPSVSYDDFVGAEPSYPPRSSDLDNYPRYADDFDDDEMYYQHGGATGDIARTRNSVLTLGRLLGQDEA
ncbi:hypothetical protein TrVFT333_010497 [Trichoderma virens FT-333]|nr:hypothetical protein TrVFT333_010497 [Trichoderma virens FT-333]